MVPTFLRSLETLTSHHGMRWLFKLLLKKRLGEFILGEIDLDQLEVEMVKNSRMASIQLRDLSLDPDAINNKYIMRTFWKWPIFQFIHWASEILETTHDTRLGDEER